MLPRMNQSQVFSPYLASNKDVICSALKAEELFRRSFRHPICNNMTKRFPALRALNIVFLVSPNAS